MNDEVAQETLEKALKMLKSELDSFGGTIGERPIMFRIAHYMACFAEQDYLTVDCDYNRYNNDPKTFNALPYKQEVFDKKTTKRFFPDIVVHQRKADYNNILVCEIKRTGDPRNADKDHERLKILTEQSGKFRYRVGAFIEVDQQECKINVVYFKNGEKSGEPKTI